MAESPAQRWGAILAAQQGCPTCARAHVAENLSCNEARLVADLVQTIYAKRPSAWEPAVDVVAGIVRRNRPS